MVEKALPFHSFSFTLVADRRPRAALRMAARDGGMYELHVENGPASSPSSQFTREVPLDVAERLRDALQAAGAFGWEESYGDATAPGSRRWSMTTVLKEGVFTVSSKGGSDAPAGFDAVLEELYRLDFPRPDATVRSGAGATANLATGLGTGPGQGAGLGAGFGIGQGAGLGTPGQGSGMGAGIGLGAGLSAGQGAGLGTVLNSLGSLGLGSFGGLSAGDLGAYGAVGKSGLGGLGANNAMGREGVGGPGNPGSLDSLGAMGKGGFGGLDFSELRDAFASGEMADMLADFQRDPQAMQQRMKEAFSHMTPDEQNRLLDTLAATGTASRAWWERFLRGL